MIRADFVYEVETKNLDKLMAKFQQSGAEKFNSEPTHVKMEMAMREEYDKIYVSLNFYYNSLDDYMTRSKFEQSQSEWMDIWFTPNDFFKQVSLNVYEIN
ncbi:hypothetical protein [Lactobacillus terrae]|uniref:hypothetical protein n=1 Tax=Lactobacillus terrae TaxID=2269374 RepID=UPI000C1B6F39|nr:hypothetical protein [Lactobacillus terrae]